jgi:hypothetical protein
VENILEDQLRRGVLQVFRNVRRGCARDTWLIELCCIRENRMTASAGSSTQKHG